MLLEASFRERRRRVLRAEAGVAVASVLGLLLVFAAKTSAAQHVELATACFVVAMFGSMLRVWRVANRHWRCPACDVRWETRETLASFQWNHCPSCGAPLRAHPREREQERVARTAFVLEGLPPETLRRRFERRRRRALWASGAAIAAGVAALAWVQGRASGEWVEHALVAGFGAVVAATLVWGMRCPRCQTGVIAEGRHCMRCGFRLEADPAVEQREDSPLGR